jgi:stage V sporulation protein AB
MWVREVLLAVIGLSAGLIVAGGLFAFIASLGVVSDIADRTHTGSKILLYEDSTTLGGILGNLIFVYRIPIPGGTILQIVVGLFTGIFVGCWALSLAETLNVFPIFVRRVKLVRCIPYIILAIAIGKGIGSMIYFFLGW